VDEKESFAGEVMQIYFRQIQNETELKIREAVLAEHDRLCEQCRNALQSNTSHFRCARGMDLANRRELYAAVTAAK
jgi:hypothetical protein